RGKGAHEAVYRSTEFPVSALAHQMLDEGPRLGRRPVGRARQSRPLAPLAIKHDGGRKALRPRLEAEGHLVAGVEVELQRRRRRQLLAGEIVVALAVDAER